MLISIKASKTDADTLTTDMILYFEWKKLGWNYSNSYLIWPFVLASMHAA